MRNIGSAIGVSLTTTVLADSVQTIHSQLSAMRRRSTARWRSTRRSMMMNPQIPFGLANLNRLIEYRAQVSAYANDFLFMFLCQPAGACRDLADEAAVHFAGAPARSSK